MTRHRAAALLVTSLVGTLLPLLATVPAQAAACLDETHTETILGPTGCDDVAPPETTLTQVEPTPTVFGYTRTKDVTFTFAGAHGDGDTDPIGFECQLFDTAVAPDTWSECASPTTYTGLADSTTTPYTFRVRAVDTKDAGISACDGSADVLDPLCVGEEPAAPADDDIDPTPSSTTVRIDTVAPNTFLDGRPVDDIRPDWPVVLTSSPTLQLNSNETAGFACTLDGRAFPPCTQGVVTVADLPGGSHTFLARAYDAAFNIDPTPESTTFFVPSNLRKNKGSGWSRRRQAGLFGNDYLTSSKVGQVVVVKGAKRVREIRLLAPTGPGFGKVEVKVGTSQWYTVNLYSKRPKALVQLLVRDEFSPARSGTIQIRVKQLGAGRSSVRIDAIVARGNCRTCGD
jgi:hypothetical protein